MSRGSSSPRVEAEAGKRLQLVKELLPRASRIVYLYQSNFIGVEIDLTLFPAIARQRPDALVVSASPFI